MQNLISPTNTLGLNSNLCLTKLLNKNIQTHTIQGSTYNALCERIQPVSCFRISLTLMYVY